MNEVLIKGGQAYCVEQRLAGQTRDILVKDGRIEAVSEEIHPEKGWRLVDARMNLVSPGFIDLHMHLLDGFSLLGVPWHCCPKLGVTTAADAGTCNWISVPGFVEHFAKRASIELLFFVNVSLDGLLLIGSANARPSPLADTSDLVQTLRSHTQEGVGVKVRLSDGFGTPAGLAPLALGLAAGKECDLPLMCHIQPKVPLQTVLSVMRPGDIVTHSFIGYGTEFGSTILSASGSLHSYVKEARTRGVLFDVGHGRRGFSRRTALQGLAQDFAPDIISSDLHRFCKEGADLLSVMAKFLSLGMPLGKILECVTYNPAKALGRENEIGTLGPGTRADITLFSLVQEPISFIDGMGDAWQGEQTFRVHRTFSKGREVYAHPEI